MNSFFLDASAFAKRYSLETGSARVDYLIDNVTYDRLMCLMLGAAEVASVLVRRRNSGVLSLTAFAQGMTNLKTEVVDADEFHTLSMDNDLIAAAMGLIDKHAINATDAVVLRLALDVVAQLRADGHDLVLVASDQRLLRAAQAEGLLSFDPERQTEADLDVLLTT
jgi:predicted nucleic acid-binding protein